MKTRHYQYTSILLLTLIIMIGYANKIDLKDIIKWSDHPITWLDFLPVKQIDDEFDANIYSEIYCPNYIDKNNPLVYAYMDPNQSERLKDSLSGSQLLKHEQYHFNITEYYARLLRKEIIQIGELNLSESKLGELYNTYLQERADMQSEYDEVSEHNLDFQKQRYWELKIDDLLRQTAYYKNPNVYSYYDFTKQSTEYYKHIYHTLEHEILTSYPISKDEHKYGESYKVERTDNDEVIIGYYKNGKLTNGGVFKTAITKIIKPNETTSEIHYYNDDLSPNSILNRSIGKTVWNTNNDMTTTYYDAENNPVEYRSVHKTVWKYDSKTNNRYSSYYDINQQQITNNDQVFHERREFDNLGRTIKIVSFDAHHQLINDKDYTSIYDYVIDEAHKIKRTRLYDKDGNFATHKEEYNTHYTYDERGNLIKFVNLDKNGDQIENKNGISIYTYSYDLYDNLTSLKRYNSNDLPVIGNDDYFMKVLDYDHRNRIKFSAKYYNGYVLAFDNNRNGASRYEYQNDSIYNILNIDVYGNLYENDHGFAIKKQYTNTEGKITKEIFLDEQGCFAFSPDGVEIYEYDYDNKGNITNETRLDSLGNLKAYSFDITRTHWEYDSRNNKIKTSYYNDQDELANANQNVTYNVYTYNKDNLLTERINYNKYKKPTLLDGVFKTKYYYNNIGQDTLVKEFDTQNRLIKGVSTTRYTYNEYGNILRQTYYNSKNQRASYKNRVSSIEYLYDNRQRYIGYKNYNKFDRPIEDENGVFHEKQIIDTAGYTTCIEYFNKKNLPTLGPTEYHKALYVYNDSNLLISESTYGTDLNLIEDSDGIAEYKYTRIPSSLINSVKYYDENGNLTENQDGAAEVTYQDTMNGLYFLDKQLNIKGEEINNDIEE